MTLSGNCLCGACTWEIQGAPHPNLMCHCRDCQTAAASPMIAFIGATPNNVTFNGPVNHFQSSPGSWRGFCQDCGTRLYFRSDKWPNQFHIQAATLKDPHSYTPTRHVVWDSHFPWLTLTDSYPKSTQFSVAPKT